VPQPIPAPNNRKLTGRVAFIALSVIVVAGFWPARATTCPTPDWDCGRPWDNEQIWLIAADGSGLRKIADGGREQFGAVAWRQTGIELPA